MRSTALTSVLMMTIALAPTTIAGRSVGRELGDAGSWMGRTIGRLASARDVGVTLATWADVQSAGQSERVLPPPPWADDDPADSLYRAARAALSDGDYRRAADLFGRISEGYPKSTYAKVALYYQAFALYRSGDGGDLHNALSALRQLSALDPTDRGHGDAATLRTRICTALARQGDASCAERIVQQAESAAAPCPSDDDDNDVRIAALDGLLQMDADRALPILRKVLARRDACSVRLRRKALFLVSQKESAESADILLSVARGDPEPELRKQAVFWLSQVEDPRVVGILDSIATHPGDESVRERALFSLSQQSDHRGIDALRRAAESEDVPTELREKAVFWLGQSGGASGATYLKDLFARTKSEQLQERILFGVSQHEGEGDWLLGIGADDKVAKEVRKKAVFWASQGDVGIGRFVNLYDRTPDQDLREQVIFALSQRRDSAAVDALMHIAKTDKDQELRKKAVFWLGQSSDPRAAKFLQELIDQ
jgi:HEAT repeat protein